MLKMQHTKSNIAAAWKKRAITHLKQDVLTYPEEAATINYNGFADLHLALIRMENAIEQVAPKQQTLRWGDIVQKMWKNHCRKCYKFAKRKILIEKNIRFKKRMQKIHHRVFVRTRLSDEQAPGTIYSARLALLHAINKQQNTNSYHALNLASDTISLSAVVEAVQKEKAKVETEKYISGIAVIGVDARSSVSVGGLIVNWLVNGNESDTVKFEYGDLRIGQVCHWQELPMTYDKGKKYWRTGSFCYKKGRFGGQCELTLRCWLNGKILPIKTETEALNASNIRRNKNLEKN